MRILRKALLALLLAGSATALVPQVAQAQEDRSTWLEIELGKSIVLEAPRNATVIAITDPEVANVQPLGGASKIQIQGRKVGTTDLVIDYGPGTEGKTYEIYVHQDLSDLIRRIDSIVEGEPPRVYPMKERIAVQGTVPDLETLERVAQVAGIYDEDFVNLMRVAGDHQVQLEVVFAEVSRTALREVGINLMWGSDSLAAALLSPITGSRTISAPELTTLQNGQLTSAATSGFSAMTFIEPIGGLGAVLNVLDEHNVAKVLAQPTMVCLSGQDAEFLAGGQVPIPAGAGLGTVSIQFKDYGIKMAFVPTVLGNNVIDTQVHVEMSEPDWGNAITITGAAIPGFRTRKASSHLRLDSGMTFAMAGLLSEQMSYTRDEVPGLGRIPVLGALFRYARHYREEKELVIFVTPRLVRPLGPGEIPAAPGTTEDNNPNDLEFFLLGLGHRPSSRTAKPTGEVGLHR